LAPKITKMEFDENIYLRDINDLKLVLKHGKVNPKNLTNISQAIYYPNDAGGNLKLLELDETLLKEIESGNKLYFKGGLHEQVILCASDKCYEVKTAEISNSLLALPVKLASQTSKSPLKSPTAAGEVNKSLDRSLEDDSEMLEDEPLDITIEDKPIVKIFHEYFELREIKPKLKKIHDLLKLTPYCGPENEDGVDKKHLFSYSQLLRTVQCSEGEFQKALEQFRCLELNSKLRILEQSYEFRVLSLMLGVMSENSWNVDEVDKDITVDSLDGIVPTEICSKLFDFLTTRNDSTGKFQYKEEMVARIIAANILQSSLKFRIDDFMSTWQETLPEGMHVQEKYLSGIGIIDRDSNPPCIKSLLEDDLPTTILERLKVLFKTKDRWSLELISPYIE
jgi:sister chromatid cohesion protein DCC1